MAKFVPGKGTTRAEFEALEYNKWDSQIKDVDELAGTDLKINPDFYIHTGILKAQDALIKEDAKAGFLQYQIMINHIEVLCKAADMIDPEYYEELEKFKKSEEYKGSTDTLLKGVKLATKKLELMMGNVFKSKAIIDSVKA